MSEKIPLDHPTKIRFVYSTPEGHQAVYVNGAYGGVSPKGELLCHFFFEHIIVPTEEKMSLVEGHPQHDKASRTFKEKPEPGELVMQRDIKVSVIIPPQEISSIANWMLDKLKKSDIVVEKEEKMI